MEIGKELIERLTRQEGQYTGLKQAVMRQAIHIQPSCPEAYYNLGIRRLLTGNFDEGWKEYEWRLKCDDINSEKRNSPQPSRDGTNLNGKSILI